MAVSGLSWSYKFQLKRSGTFEPVRSNAFERKVGNQRITVFLIQSKAYAYFYIDISTVLMVVHQDSIDETILNQIKSCFQTIVDTNEKTLKKTNLIFNKLNKNLLKYELKIKHKNFKSSTKISSYVRLSSKLNFYA